MISKELLEMLTTNKKCSLGIILAAGKSSRLYPATLVTTKQLLPVYDKPLIFYPLTTLMLAGIRDVVIIANEGEIHLFKELFRKSGLMHECMNFHFLTQEKPNGIPEAFNIVQNYMSGCVYFDSATLILGDNIFHGATMSGEVRDALQKEGASIFATKVPDLHRFGVVNVSNLTITEKPTTIEDTKNSYAITGLYNFPNTVFDVVKNLKPSARGETEITDVINHYKDLGNLNVHTLKRGVSWFDTGTPDSLLDASHYVKTIQTNAGHFIGSPHEVAYNNGWLSKEQLEKYLQLDSKSPYSKYLMELLNARE